MMTVTESTSMYTVNDHFQGKEAHVRQLYDRLLEVLRTLGPVNEDPKKTSIHLVNRTAMAGVYVRRDWIILEFKSNYAIDSSLLTKSEQLSKTRWHNTLRLDSPRQLQGDVLKWLTDSYHLSA